MRVHPLGDVVECSFLFRRSCSDQFSFVSWCGQFVCFFFLVSINKE